MEVKPGYKDTEVGVIPNDWVVKSIGSFSVIFGRIGFRGYTKKDIVKEGQGAIALSPSNIQSSKLFLDDCTYVTWEKYHESPEIKVQVGDVLLVKTGSTTGKTCYVDHLPTDATLNPQMVVFKKFAVNPRLIGYIFSSPVFQDQITSTVVGGALPTLSQKQVAAYKLPLPPTDEEQCAIATALSDVDALLDGLTRLIAKKRDLKQAAMQQLLTGQTRLPGFSGPWEVKRFGEVLVRLNAKAYQVQATEYVTTGKYPVVDQGKQLVVGFSDREDKKLCCPDGGVIVFGDHTCVVKYVDFDFLVGADGTQVLRGNQGQSTHFHALQLQYRGIASTGYNRHFKFLAEREFQAPSLPEQTAIATVLSDMDAELAALEARLAKTRALKQAMMQELLTGQTRLA